MDKKQANDVATNMLINLIKHQPGLIQFNGSSGPTGFGQDAAKFCTDFIDTYADWLIKSRQQY